MNRRLIGVGLGLGLGGIVAFAAATWVVLETYIPMGYHSAGWFRRAQYEAIVERVGTFAVPELPSRPLQLLMTDRADLGTLRVMVPAARASYHRSPEMQIWATRTATDFRVTLITNDSGHAGKYGFAYTRAGWKNGDFVPGDVWIDETIDEHWARVMNNLQ